MEEEDDYDKKENWKKLFFQKHIYYVVNYT